MATGLALAVLSGCRGVAFLRGDPTHACALRVADGRGSSAGAVAVFDPATSDADERNYSHCLAAAERLENRSDARCVDWFFAAARVAWRRARSQQSPCDHSQAWKDYNFALAELLRTAQRFGRLDARRTLVVHHGSQITEIPVVHHGFVWCPADFQRILAPPIEHEKLLRRRYRRAGLGTAVVVQRRRRDGDAVEARFLPPQSWFAATAVLHFENLPPLGSVQPDRSSTVLTFYDPLRIHEATVDGEPVRLASDLSAPLAVTVDQTPSTYLAGFLRPGESQTQARLDFTEAFQPDKVPVVLIHGLYSDPQAWADMLNDLRCDPVFVQRFQLWEFRYPTGSAFLQSAARLREELQAAAAIASSPSQHTALEQMVLVGHSMGGLIAKLQVTYSEDRIWRRIANRPIDEIHTTPETRSMLLQSCFFDPVPTVRRVVFIATPHCGASSANGLLGRTVSHLVRPPPDLQAAHDQLMRENPGVFADYVAQGLPTSVDLLESSSPILAAVRELKFGPGVYLHGITGDRFPITGSGPSDGVVPVSSAYHPGCASELRLAETHTSIHRSPYASAEILRILQQHLEELPLTVPPR